MSSDKLNATLEALKAMCLDLLIQKACAIIGDDTYKSLSEEQTRELKKFFEEIIYANKPQ
jgi:hypothetical protein